MCVRVCVLICVCLHKVALCTLLLAAADGNVYSCTNTCTMVGIKTHAHTHTHTNTHTLFLMSAVGCT